MTDAVATPIRDPQAIAACIPAVSADVRGSVAQIGELVALIAREYRPERVILFGSRAYGTPTYDSDVDLMVVMDTPLRPADQAVAIRERLELEPSFSLDVLARTPDQIAEGDFFVEDVFEKGIVLYEGDNAGVDRQGRG